MKWYNSICQFLFKIKQDTSSYRRQETQKEADQTPIEGKAENYIICNGEHVPIEWDDVKTFDNSDGLKLPKNCYKTAKNERVSSMLVAHWDVCLSSKSCFKILKKRKLSVHFLIDNDGTIYQIMDCNDIGYHAGNSKVNARSIGVEISNAYYPKYQEIYRSKGFGPRPLWKGVEVHGKELEPFLGFYPWQEEAFKALAKVLNKTYQIELVSPMNDGEPIKTVDPLVKKGKFNGVVNHYHITTRKIDCAGFDLDEVLEEIT